MQELINTGYPVLSEKETVYWNKLKEIMIQKAIQKYMSEYEIVYMDLGGGLKSQYDLLAIKDNHTITMETT